MLFLDKARKKIHSMEKRTAAGLKQIRRRVIIII